MTKDKIKFNEKNHTYSINGKYLTSVTTAINTIFPPFDAKGIARKIAKGFKYRTRQKELQGEKVDDETKAKGTMRFWLAKWKESAHHGTRVHKAVEEFINIGDPAMILDKYCPKELDKVKFGAFLSWYQANPILAGATLLPEMIVYSGKQGYAGMLDLVVMQEDGTMHIFDWKTNEKLISPQPCMLEKPFEHLDDSKMCRYSLQLSFYKYLMELSGKKVGNLILVHLTPEGVKEYKCEYLKDDVKKLIEVCKNE